GRREGQRNPAARAWRRARSHRQHDGRCAAVHHRHAACGEGDMIGVAVLGATGSIGVSTLDVIARHRDRYAVRALTANGDVAGMGALCRQWRHPWAVMADPAAAEALQAALANDGVETEVLGGPEALARAASRPDVDYVMAAIVGAAGLVPTLA